MAAPPTKPKRSTSWILGALFAGHILFASQRLVLKSMPGRWREIADYHDRGAVRFHLGRSDAAASVVERLIEATPPTAVIPFRGVDRGQIEQAAALLAPRLLYREDAMPVAGLVVGRPRARLSLDEGPPVPVVLVATAETLRLEPR